MLICDHTSVGIIVRRDADILLIRRKTSPIAFAPPAGHVDQHGSFDEAARIELFEEVGLSAVRLNLIAEGRRENHCRRPDGTWHYWKIYEAIVSGIIRPSERETQGFVWASQERVGKLMHRTESYSKGLIAQREWEANPGLEPVWKDWFEQLNLGLKIK